MSSINLNTIEEERELKFDSSASHCTGLLNTECSDSSSNSKSKFGHLYHGGIPQGTVINHPEAISSRSNFGRRGPAHWQESHPKNMGMAGSSYNISHGGNAASMGSKADITNPSFAYHTSHAFSSNYNPVSKQNSEIQSQSSGALEGKLKSM